MRPESGPPDDLVRDVRRDLAFFLASTALSVYLVALGLLLSALGLEGTVRAQVVNVASGFLIYATFPLIATMYPMYGYIRIALGSPQLKSGEQLRWAIGEASLLMSVPNVLALAFGLARPLERFGVGLHPLVTPAIMLMGLAFIAWSLRVR